MKSRKARLAATLVTAAIMAAGSVMASSATAQAAMTTPAMTTPNTITPNISTPTWFSLSNTGHGVGVYTHPWVGGSGDTASVEFESPLFWRAGNPDQAQLDCWTTGGEVGNYGDVWYHIEAVYYARSNQEIQTGGGWVYAPFFDGSAEFHNRVLDVCDI